MADKKDRTSSKKNTKYKTAQQEKLTANDFLGGYGKMEIFSFCVGFSLLVVSLFALASFVSYLFTGEADFSLLESGADPLNSQLQFKNICKSWGAVTAYYFINQLFGLASFLIPPYLIIVGLRLMRAFKFTLVRKFVLTVLLIVWASVALAAVEELVPFMGDTFVKLGGNHGTNVCRIIMQVMGVPGLIGILILYAVLYFIYVSAKTIAVVRAGLRLSFMKRKRAHSPETAIQTETKTEPAVGVVPPENLGERDHMAYPEDPFGETDTASPSGSGEVPLIFDSVDVTAPSDDQSADQPASPTMTIEANETAEGDGEIQRGGMETPYDPKLDLEYYKYPTLDLLNSAEGQNPQTDMAEQEANKARIIHVLRNFQVEISSIKATIGPTITLYEIIPVEGTRISKIRNLEDDIALSLSAEGIRIIAPIPGKGTIGIEVPNKRKCIVSMESIIRSRAYQESRMELPCAIGKTISNEVFMFDLAKAPHLLVAGATGQGKSVGLNAIVTSLLYKKHPSELKIVMIDPKKVEFGIYAPIENHFLARLEEEDECIITEVQKVVKTLNSLCALMDTRYDMLKKAHVRNIKEYNEKYSRRQLNPEHGHEYMPYIVVIVDEFGDLIMQVGKEVELPICRIAQLARAVGIHMIIATQRPQASIISGAIKTNFPSRIAFKVSSMMDSRVILDQPGANQLIGKGDMLYLQGGEPVRVQCAFVDTPEVDRICQHISTQQSFLHPLFLPEVEIASDGGGAAAGSMDKGHVDSMFGEVAKYVVSNQNGSTSMIQRNFSIGYNRAGKIMDQLEKMGVVGPQSGAKPREVLIKDALTLESLLNTL